MIYQFQSLQKTQLDQIAIQKTFNAKKKTFFLNYIRPYLGPHEQRETCEKLQVLL